MWTELPDLNSILLYSKIRIKTEEKAKVVAVGQKGFNSLPH